MDLLKRELAPITDRAWAAIEKHAERLLKTALTARKVVDFQGPHGWDFNAVPLGRMEAVTRDADKGFEYGIRAIQPLMEHRAFFELETWDLDNAERGDDQLSLEPLDQAALRAAMFEERAILRGLPEGRISGLLEAVGDGVVPMTLDAGDIIEGAARGVALLLQAGVGGPHALLVSPSVWEALSTTVGGYPAFKHLGTVLSGPVLLSPLLDGALLLSLRGGDFQLIVGQDFSIGYHSHTHEKVRLFFTQSFTFRIIEPKALLRLAQQ